MASPSPSLLLAAAITLTLLFSYSVKLPFHPRDLLPLLPRQLSWPILNSLHSAVDLLPTFVGSASSQNNTLGWKGACFYQNTAWMEFHNKTGSQFGGGTLHIKVSKAHSWTCMDIYVFATPYTVTWDYYLLSREHTLEFKEWTGKAEYEFVKNRGVSIFLMQAGMLGTLQALWDVFPLFTNTGWGELSNIGFLKKHMGATFEQRPQPWVTNISTDDIHSGDFLAISKIRGRWGGFETLEKWVSGAYAGHSAVCLRDSEGKLWVGESGNENEQGEDIIAILPWDEWWDFELNKDDSDPHIALLPLHPDIRAKFNETAAWEYARSMEPKIHMRSLAGIWVLPSCSKVSSFNGRLSSSSFASRFDGPDTPNYVVLKSSQFAAAASVSGSGAQYSGSGGLLGVQTKEKKKKKEGIAGIDQDELVEDPKLLADPDSCFCEFSGVEIHHKVYEAQLKVHETESVSSETKTAGLAMILLHGFGASVFSWKRVMKPLAEAIGSKVLAFDRPAFGLTSRGNSVRHLSSGNGESKPVNPYSMAFSVLATLYFIDFLAAEKAIIVGHSAGSLVAVESYFEALERVAALILVAPAIFAPITTQKVDKGSQPGTNNQTEEDGSNSVDNGNPFVQFSKVLSKFARFISQAIMGLVKGMAVMLNSLYKKFLSALLRSAFAIMLVRMAINKFGIAAVRNAWYDSKKVTDEDISGYTKPLRTKGWDKALVEYTAAMLTDTSSESKPPLAKRLRDIKCPVLIVTGDTDRIVPSWNAKRLSKAIPGSCFEVIKRCGHLPHEEKVDEFVSIVKKFLQTAFDDSPQEQLRVIV